MKKFYCCRQKKYIYIYILWIIRLLREIDSADMKAKKKKKKGGISKLKFWNVNGKK